jgi:hypothetical protein
MAAEEKSAIRIKRRHRKKVVRYKNSGILGSWEGLEEAFPLGQYGSRNFWEA